MRLAVLSDIHSNLEALRACVEHARGQGARRYAFLGDLVGYGADPVACLELIQELLGTEGIAVLGNHDQAALTGWCDEMGFEARDAIYWTREQFQERHYAFLRSLPLTARHRDFFFVHASADDPEKWTYVTDGTQAARCMSASQAPVTLVGHVHHQLLYHTPEVGRPRSFHPTAGIPVPLSRQRRWLALVGSVGQPRDGNQAAAYAMLDDEQNTITFFRVVYDYVEAARKIVAAGLPERFARRLETAS